MDTEACQDQQNLIVTAVGGRDRLWTMGQEHQSANKVSGKEGRDQDCAENRRQVGAVSGIFRKEEFPAPSTLEGRQFLVLLKPKEMLKKTEDGGQ